MVGGTALHGMAAAAPLKEVVIDKSLIADGPEKLGPTAEVLAASRAYLEALQQGNGQAIAAFWTTTAFTSTLRDSRSPPARWPSGSLAILKPKRNRRGGSR